MRLSDGHSWNSKEWGDRWTLNLGISPYWLTHRFIKTTPVTWAPFVHFAATTRWSNINCSLLRGWPLLRGYKVKRWNGNGKTAILKWPQYRRRHDIKSGKEWENGKHCLQNQEWTKVLWRHQSLVMWYGNKWLRLRLLCGLVVTATQWLCCSCLPHNL